MPFIASRYPADWKAISRAIRVRSGGQCECAGECGLHHDRRCNERNGTEAKWAKGKIVLTVAHLRTALSEMDCRDEVLKAMCQRCHLRYDQALHIANSRATRRSKKAHTDLFQEGA